MVSLFDVKAEYGMTVSVSREGVKLTRAAIGAIAMREFPSFKHPLDVRHGYPSPQPSRATANTQVIDKLDNDVAALTPDARPPLPPALVR
jgi:hypothetical protein